MKQTLASFEIQSLEGQPGSGYKVRYAADVPFEAETGEVYLAGDSQRNYIEITLTQDGVKWDFPTSVFDTTTDSTDPNATYSAWVVNSRGTVLESLFERWAFPASFPTTVTRAMLEAHNTDRAPLRDDQVYTKTQTELLIAEANEVGDPATTTALGTVKLTTAAADPANPKAVSDTDPRVSTISPSPAGSYTYMSGTFDMYGRLLSGSSGSTPASNDYAYNAKTEYNAAGLGQQTATHTTTGSISSGTNSLTVASATGWAVGHGILIVGAGAAGADLITSITNIVGTTFTLNTNASVSVSGVGVWHDDTVAIQAAITAACVVGGEVFLPAGIYDCNGPLGAHNGILELSQNTSSTTVGFRLRGEIVGFTADDRLPRLGTIIRSTRRAGAGTRPALLAGRAYATGWNYTNVFLKDLVFRLGTDPTISAVQFHQNIGVQMDTVSFDTGVALSAMVEPTTSTVYAAILPATGNFAQIALRNVSVYGGFHNALYMAEHTLLDNCFLTRCKRAMHFGEGINHAVKGFVYISHCPTWIRTDGIASFHDFKIGAERWTSTGEWYAPGAGGAVEFDKAGGVVSGRISYEITVAGSGPSASAKISHNINPASNSTLVLNPILAGHNLHGISEIVYGGPDFGIKLQTEDASDGNTIRNVASGGSQTLHLYGNANHGGGVTSRYDVAVGATDLYTDPATRSMVFQSVASGANPVAGFTQHLFVGPSSVVLTPNTTIAGTLTWGGGDTVTRVKHGRATLVAGVATVLMASITANSNIHVERQTDGGTVGASYSKSRVVGTSFTITSKDGSGATQTLDTSTVAYWIVEPV